MSSILSNSYLYLRPLFFSSSFFLFFFLRRIHSIQQITFYEVWRLRVTLNAPDYRKCYFTFVKRAVASNANIGSVIDIEDFDRNNKHNLRNNLQVYHFLKPLYGFHQKLYMLYRLLCYITTHKVHILQLNQQKLNFINPESISLH